MPPDIGGGFSSFGFLWTNQVGRHIRNSVHGGKVERIVFGIFCIPEDRIVFGGPLLLGSGTIVISPDYFVHEAVASKDFV